MTIQVTVANAYGIAMASDRHVYRHGYALSNGRQSKLVPLRTPMPAAMMAAGTFSLFGVPLSRLALSIERALAAAPEAGPDALAECVLDVLDAPLPAMECEQDRHRRDVESLARTAELVAGRARAFGEADDGMVALLREIERAPRCRGGEAVEAHGRSLWESSAAVLPGLARCPIAAGLLNSTPALMQEAVIGAMVRDWTRPADANLAVGLCCPRSGVPAVVSVNLWKGLGDRLLFAPRHDRPCFSLHQAGRSLLLSQGSGRQNVLAMLDGNAGEATDEAAETARKDARWERLHDRVSVSSVEELTAIASGLVRGAEIVGYLTGEDESSVIEVDWARLTPAGLVQGTLGV